MLLSVTKHICTYLFVFILFAVWYKKQLKYTVGSTYNRLA